MQTLSQASEDRFTIPVVMNPLNFISASYKYVRNMEAFYGGISNCVLSRHQQEFHIFLLVIAKEAITFVC